MTRDICALSSISSTRTGFPGCPVRKSSHIEDTPPSKPNWLSAAGMPALAGQPELRGPAFHCYSSRRSMPD